MAGSSQRDPQDPPRASLADPTRDIRLPPLPGTAGPGLPPEWEALRTDGDRSAPEPTSPRLAAPAADDTTSETLVNQPTDELGRRPEGVRDKTLTFRGTSAQRWAAGHPATPDPAWSSVPAAPGPAVAPRPRPDGRSRRWPWVVLTMVPILVIVVTGVWLLILMRG